MEKVIIIDSEPLTKGRAILFYLDQLKSDGFCVKVWDVSAFSNRGVNLPDKVKDYGVQEVHNISEFILLLSSVDISNTFFITEINKEDNYFKLYKELTKRNCFIGRFDFYSHIVKVDVKERKQKNSVISIISNLIIRIVEYIKVKFFVWKWKNIKYDIYLTAKSVPDKTGDLNHPDYNRFLLFDELPIIKSDYFVFCDNFYPLHPDLKPLIKNPDPLSYRNIMNKLFDMIESKYKCQVVIAAHPKADYQGTEFNGRKIIKYHTDNLVYFSKGVIMHASGSLAYAVTRNIPICFVTTDDMNGLSVINDCILGNSQLLGIPVLNLNNYDMEDIRFSYVKENLREKYIYGYLTTPQTEKIDNYNIIKQTIRNAKR